MWIKPLIGTVLLVGSSFTVTAEPIEMLMVPMVMDQRTVGIKEIERPPVHWDFWALGNAAIDLAGALTSTGSATSLI